MQIRLYTTIADPLRVGVSRGGPCDVRPPVFRERIACLVYGPDQRTPLPRETSRREAKSLDGLLNMGLGTLASGVCFRTCEAVTALRATCFRSVIQLEGSNKRKSPTASYSLVLARIRIEDRNTSDVVIRQLVGLRSCICHESHFSQFQKVPSTRLIRRYVTSIPIVTQTQVVMTEK